MKLQRWPDACFFITGQSQREVSWVKSKLHCVWLVIEKLFLVQTSKIKIEDDKIWAIGAINIIAVNTFEAVTAVIWHSVFNTTRLFCICVVRKKIGLKEKLWSSWRGVLNTNLKRKWLRLLRTAELRRISICFPLFLWFTLQSTRYLSVCVK